MNDPLIIDTSFWRPGDKAWAQARKEKWPDIERSICIPKTKKAMNIIKRYYLKGELPDWAAINKEWDHGDIWDRHLDIATLLWLHPSADVAVLKPLRDAYFAGHGRTHQDVLAGMFFIMRWGIYVPSMNDAAFIDCQPAFPPFEGKARLLFDLIYAGMEDLTFEFGTDKRKNNCRALGLAEFDFSCKWLCFKKLTEHGGHMLLQHDFPLEMLFRNLNSDPKEIYREIRLWRGGLENNFYRICHFNTKKEGDTPRTTFVTKIRKILDEGDHLPEFKALWEQVKRGEVTVDKPWKL